MVIGSDPICRAQVFALITGDRDQGQLSKEMIERDDMRQIKSTVKGGYRAPSKVLHQGTVQKIDVKMQNIKFVCPSSHFFKHDYVVR